MALTDTKGKIVATQLPDIDLSAFPAERECALADVWRYSMFETMLYRSNNLMHARRVLWIVEELIPLLAPNLVLDSEKTRTMALVHDDMEIVIGDIQAGHKAQMNKEQLAQLDATEEAAINELALRYPKTVNGYSYRDLLHEERKKGSVEAQLVSYADKLDAYNEALHDVLGGNLSLLTSVIFYTRFFAQVKDRLPLLVPGLDGAAPSPFVYPFIQSPKPEEGPVTHAAYQEFSGKPHTKESIRKDSVRFPFYDAWKKLVLTRGGDEGERWLIEQHESLPA